MLGCVAQEGKKLMGQLAANDAKKREAAATKNDLESYIIATSGTLDEPQIEQVGLVRFMLHNVLPVQAVLHVHAIEP